MKKILLTALIASSTLLSGCLFPEKFTTKIEVNPDTSYHVMYSGTSAHVPAVMQIASSKKPLGPKDEAAMQQEAATISKGQGVKKASYIGNGRFEIEVDAIRKAGVPTNLFDVFKVSTDKEGVMTISTPQISENDKAKLNKAGLSINGTLEVILPRNAEVISSNATSSPSFFGSAGTYSWKIGSIEIRPMMKIRFKK